MSEGLESGVPVLVPHSHLGDEHIGRGGAQTMLLVVGGAGLGCQWGDSLKVPYTGFAGLAGVHPGQHREAVKRGEVLDVVEIERHVAEERSQGVVVERPQDLGLAQEPYPVGILLVDFVGVLVDERLGFLDAVDGKVAALDSEVALGPHRLPVAGRRGRYVQTGVQGAGRAVSYVGTALRGEHKCVVVVALHRNVAAVDHGFALRLGPEVIVRGGNGGEVLLKRAG